MRIALAASALAVLGLAATPAVAGTPKQGYYIDPGKQVYVIVTKDRKAIKSFQGNCYVKGQDGTPQASASLSTGKSTRIKISAGGAFSFTGTLYLPGANAGTKTSLKAKVTGSFKGGKAKGTYEASKGDFSCLSTSFSGKYYGVNPQG